MDKTKFYMDNEDTCIRLKLYGENLRKLLVKNGWIETDKETADYIFINTCSFIKKMEEKSLAKVRAAELSKKPYQEVVVFGCLPSISPDELKKIHSGPSFPERELDRIIEYFHLNHYERETSHVVKKKLNLKENIIKYLNRLFFKNDYVTYLYEKEKVYHIQISEGCLGNCSYCAERLARGRLKSKRTKDVVEDFKRGLEKGYKIFGLNADDTSVFGKDNNESISMLLEEILKINGDYRIIITEFNPFELVNNEKMISLLGSKKVSHITVPIQSGNQRILNLMRRPYNVEDVLESLKKIRKLNPALHVSTHFIVGFPTETWEEFLDTVSLMEKFQFNKVKIFKYSDRKFTPASKMEGKICEEEKERRYRYAKKKERWIYLKHLKLLDLLLSLTESFG